MLQTIFQRLGLSVFTLGFVSVVVFFSVEALPGNICTAFLQRFAEGPRLERCIAEQGLETPAIQRYGQWVLGAVQGDFGTSLKQRREVAGLLAERFRNTALLAGAAAAIGIPLALTLGFWAGLTRDRPSDLAISTIAMLAMTIPEFVTASVLIFVFAIVLNWVPAVTILPPSAPLVELLPNIVLPVVVLAFVMTAHILRITRASVIEVMASDFIKMARLKGVPERQIFWRHLAPSALIPVVNTVALTFAWLLGGVVVIEQVFNYPGIGNLMLRAIYDRDLPMVQAIVLTFALIYVVANLLADLAMVLLDPRIRSAQARG